MRIETVAVAQLLHQGYLVFAWAGGQGLAPVDSRIPNVADPSGGGVLRTL